MLSEVNNPDSIRWQTVNVEWPAPPEKYVPVLSLLDFDEVAGVHLGSAKGNEHAG